MTTWDLIIALFYHVDEQLHAMPKRPEVHLWPSKVVTLELLHALKGVGNRAFYRWLRRDYRPLASSSSTRCAKAAARARSAAKVSRIIAGLSGANCVCSSISGG